MINLILKFILFILLSQIAQVAIGQPKIIDAKILDTSSNKLKVSFTEVISLTDASGFRLIGGVARIKNLVSGSGTNHLIFSLTDYVLPDDIFNLLYWPELGNANNDHGDLQAFENFNVQNLASSYHGKGKIYYVSTSGLDSFKGTLPKTPFRTISKALSIASPGDYILLKRGDTFDNTFVDISKSGSSEQFLSISVYGNGAKPILQHGSKDLFTVNNKNYILIDNLHLKVSGDGETGVYIMGSSKNTIVSNCRIEGIGTPHHGINFGKNDGNSETVIYPVILNNYISGFRWNIRSSGYPYDGTHEVIGGIIENNISAKNYILGNDGISAQRGKYHGLTIRKNEIFGYYDDGIDLFAADDVIVEYNTIHSPQQPATSGQGIKAGGKTLSEKINGHQSTNIVIRYNTLYNLNNKINNQGSYNGIQTNNGASGKIYGNLIYNVKGHGIVVSGPIEEWEVYNNTVINSNNAGLRVWTEGNKDYNVKIHNNILEGQKGDILITTNTTHQTVIGKNNILLTGKTSGNYTSPSDKSADINDILVNPSKGDFQLKKNIF